MQTLSRLNRTYPGKDRTFILDFVNEADDIAEAFAPYYRTTFLARVSDPNDIYALSEKLHAPGIFLEREVDAFADAFFDDQRGQDDLLSACRPAVDRYRRRLMEATRLVREAEAALEHAHKHGSDVDVQNAERSRDLVGEHLDALETFRRNLRGFGRLYEFLSQIDRVGDHDLEKLNVFAKHLYPLLPHTLEDTPDIDLSNVEMKAYQLSKQEERKIELEEGPGVRPPGGGGGGEPEDDEHKLLSEILDALSGILGTDIPQEQQRRHLEGIVEEVLQNERIRRELASNSEDKVMVGNFPKAVESAVLARLDAESEITSRIFSSDENLAVYIRTAYLLGMSSVESRV